MKLSGKQGRNSFGLLIASDNAPGNYSREERTDPHRLLSIQRFLDKNALVGVLRLKRDINREDTIGLIATSYNFIEQHNQLGGFDGRFRLNRQTTLDFQVLGTTSRRFFRDADLGSDIYRTGYGFAYSATLDRSGRNFGYFLRGEGRTRDYRADVGFTKRTNTNRELLFVRYSTDPQPKAWLISWRVSNFTAINFDWQGRLQSWTVEPVIRWQFRHQTSFGVGFTGGYERVFEEEFGAKRTATRAGAFAGEDAERTTYVKEIFAFGGTTPSKRYSAELFSVYRWGELDFDFGAGRRFPRVSPAALQDPEAPLDPGPGNSLNVEGRFAYQPTNGLRIMLNYTKSRLTRRDTQRVAFDDNIFALRSTYQFTRFTFLRARLDYSTLSASVRGQVLLGWTPNPGTALYVGYNDDLNRNGYNPFTDQLEPGLRRNGRTFFIKLSYLFQRSF